MQVLHFKFVIHNNIQYKYLQQVYNTCLQEQLLLCTIIIFYLHQLLKIFSQLVPSFKGRNLIQIIVFLKQIQIGSFFLRLYISKIQKQFLCKKETHQLEFPINGWVQFCQNFQFFDFVFSFYFFSLFFVDDMLPTVQFFFFIIITLFRVINFLKEEKHGKGAQMGIEEKIINLK
eukprot:TRINITY_DN9179_c1_g1_i3.p2 TRINITY_DN9179_c1_g1~~TRINITY_DN9179_c1_g1_i3.p2  ORF type:complete len:174 (+),score=0.49 TRINITY_DN9179_c1_g1_i3:136-657(+)